ncbi:hypothetical protein [Aureispira sp. CCB-QB1]|uniref:hypothetical protein n=1 Tax=Aureispira sp. CCB-QB1 TaxID=1313421 RepID=UPI000696D25F|nr:hypothetical protein [Aureispira sp. CCB-QB1]
MEIEKRKKIAMYLRWGDKTEIATLANVSRQTVERWIKGETVSSTVEPYIIAFSNKRKEEVERRLAAADI